MLGEEKMELLDTYNENHEFIAAVERQIVHRDALWHDTVHCWLYDEEGNIYFQERADKHKLYTTASGHVLAGETIKEAFGREVKEELGYLIDYGQAKLIEINKFILDREESDGSIFKDRAFANVYACLFKDDFAKLEFDEKELSGVVKMPALEVGKLIKGEIAEIKGIKLTKDNQEMLEKEVMLTRDDFLVNKGENILEKYGKVVDFIINLTI